MKKELEWSINGRAASTRDVAETLALSRQHRAKVARADREARELERGARSVAAAIRRHEGGLSIRCKARFVRGRKEGGRRLRRFERLVGLALSKRTSNSESGTFSFHFKLTPRGLSKRGGGSGRGYKRGEVVRTIRYILREIAREIEGGGIVSNISTDPDELASIFSALEELEMAAGRDNANVYMSLIVSLPSELTSEERLELLYAICAFLNARGIGHAGVLHAPDPEGDPRNFHAHVIFSWRPMALTEDGYAFAKETLGALNTPMFVTEFRNHAANAMNAAMESAGHPRRFTGAKTRDDPGSSVADKHGPGRKHRDRKAQKLEDQQAALATLKAQQAALASAIAVVDKWLVQPVVDREAIVRALETKDREIWAAQMRPPEVVAMAELPDSVTLPGPVSHEKPTPVADPQQTSLPFTPINSTVMSTAAEAEKRVSAVTPRSSINDGVGYPTPVNREPVSTSADVAVPPVAPTKGVEANPVPGDDPAPHDAGIVKPPVERPGSVGGEQRQEASMVRDGAQSERRSVQAPASPVTLSDDHQNADRSVTAGSADGQPKRVTLEDVRTVARTRPPRPRSTAEKKPTPQIENHVASESPNDAASTEPTDRSTGGGRSVSTESSQREPISPDSSTNVDERSRSAPFRDELDDVLRKLRAMKSSLPLKPDIYDDDGIARKILVLVPELASSDDADLVKRAQGFEAERKMQRLFREQFERFLVDVRKLISKQPLSSSISETLHGLPEAVRLWPGIEAAEGSDVFDYVYRKAKARQEKGDEANNSAVLFEAVARRARQRD